MKPWDSGRSRGGGGQDGWRGRAGGLASPEGDGLGFAELIEALSDSVDGLDPPREADGGAAVEAGPGFFEERLCGGPLAAGEEDPAAGEADVGELIADGDA